MESEELDYDVINGEIVDGETRVSEAIIWEGDDTPVEVTFDDPVSEDELQEQIITQFVNRIHELEAEPDFDYTEPQHFRGDSNISKALVEMFHICPFTTNQYTDQSKLEYASSYPSKLRDKGLVAQIGTIGSKSIWALTPKGTKEALCLLGHPQNQEQLVGVRQPQEESGLNRLFDSESLDNEEDSDSE